MDVINNDEEWGDDDDSGWDDAEDTKEEIKINRRLKLDLVWKDNNLLEKTKMRFLHERQDTKIDIL